MLKLGNDKLCGEETTKPNEPWRKCECGKDKDHDGDHKCLHCGNVWPQHSRR